MNFFCLDVETANESAASICQLGIATFLDGQHVQERDISIYVDPEDYFLDEFVEIHGIDKAMVAGAPTFSQIHGHLTDLLSAMVVLSHSAFDRVSLARACAKYRLPGIDAVWLDSLRVARRAWPERRGAGGHGLKALAKHCGITFQHHAALEDARCAGEIFLQACQLTGLSVEQWLSRVDQPVVMLDSTFPEGNPMGHLFGEIVVFTGTLSRTRGEMGRLANNAGCRVDDGVTKHTTLVVVGDQDVRYLKEGSLISAKHQKARDLIAKGKPLRVIAEADLIALLRH